MSAPVTEARAELYRRRAAEIRERASRLPDVDIRNKMEGIARQYEQMAEMLEKAQQARGAPP